MFDRPCNNTPCNTPSTTPCHTPCFSTKCLQKMTNVFKWIPMLRRNEGFFLLSKKKWRSYAIWQNFLESSSRLSRQTTLAAHYSPEWLMIRAYVGFFSHHLSYGPVCMHKSYRMAWTFQANVLGFVFHSVCLVVVHSTVNASLICLLDGSNQRTLCIK